MANVNSKCLSKTRYIAAIFVMLFFVLNDLIFDFLFDFESSDYISFACTLIAAIIVFYYSYNMKRDNIEDRFKDAATFIRSNFDNWQVLFSVLDIICGLISILSGLAFLSCIFKAVKVGYVPIKIVVVSNKSKSLVKAASKISCLWVSGRLLAESGKENIKEEDNNMFKAIWKGIKNIGLWIWSNKKSILGTIGAIVSGVASAIAANADLICEFPKLFVLGFNVTPAIIGLIIFVLTELGVSGKGFETIKGFFARINEEKAEKAALELAKKEKEAEIKAQKAAVDAAKKQADNEAKAAKEQAKLDKKATKIAEKLKAKEDAEKAKKAEEEKLLQRAQEIKAQMEAEEAAKKNA